MPAGLPWLALSVRQSWTLAHVNAGKDIESPSMGATKRCGVVPGHICIGALFGTAARQTRCRRNRAMACTLSLHRCYAQLARSRPRPLARA